MLSAELEHPGRPGAPPAIANDAVARNLLRRAQGAFQKWPEGFAGFRARVLGETATGAREGQVVFAASSGIDVECADPALRAQLFGLMRSVVTQRTPCFFDDGDGRFPICFAERPADSPWRPIDVRSRFGEQRYWIDPSGRVRRVERAVRGIRTLTVFEELARTSPGRVLPTVTTISILDEARGVRLWSETLSDTHRRVEHVWLPAGRRITSGAESRGLSLTLHDHELL